MSRKSLLSRRGSGRVRAEGAFPVCGSRRPGARRRRRAISDTERGTRDAESRDSVSARPERACRLGPPASPRGKTAPPRWPDDPGGGPPPPKASARPRRSSPPTGREGRRAGVIRTPGANQLGNRVNRSSVANQRRRRSRALRDRLTPFADRVAQRTARSDKPAPAGVGTELHQLAASRQRAHRRALSPRGRVALMSSPPVARHLLPPLCREDWILGCSNDSTGGEPRP